MTQLSGPELTQWLNVLGGAIGDPNLKVPGSSIFDSEPPMPAVVDGQRASAFAQRFATARNSSKTVSWLSAGQTVADPNCDILYPTAVKVVSVDAARQSFGDLSETTKGTLAVDLKYTTMPAERSSASWPEGKTLLTHRVWQSSREINGHSSGAVSPWTHPLMGYSTRRTHKDHMT